MDFALPAEFNENKRKRNDKHTFSPCQRTKTALKHGGDGDQVVIGTFGTIPKNSEERF